MSRDDWHRVLDEAAALGTTTVQLIGGEPTRHPDFIALMEHAVAACLNVRVYTNLFKVREAHWQLFALPQVEIATSYYSDDADQHDAITGRPGSHTATHGHIAEAVRRGVRVSVAVIDMGGGRRTSQAAAQIRALGVHQVRVDRVRAVGNAGGGLLPSVASLCGRCGDKKAAVLPDGQVAVCEIGRLLTAGSIKDTSLASVLAGDLWTTTTASIPRPAGADLCPPDCAPNDDSACGPDTSGPCGPADDSDE
jgi:MoaA/NifB/PqqE/SkfB family radical SAM enzyme